MLEAGFVVCQLRPHRFRKRLVKTPKLEFNDTGVTEVRDSAVAPVNAIGAAIILQLGFHLG